MKAIVRFELKHEKVGHGALDGTDDPVNDGHFVGYRRQGERDPIAIGLDR